MTATLTRLAFTVDPKPLAAAVAWAAKHLPSRPTVPVLAGMLLEVRDGLLTVSAYDEEAAATATLEVSAASNGTVLVSGRLLHGLLSTLDGRKPLQVAFDGNKATINYGGILTLPTLPVEDYPALPTLPDVAGTVDGAVFARLVERVAVVAGNGSDLAVLAAVALRFSAGRLTVLATDRYRGALDTIRLDGYIGPEVERLVPAAVLKTAAPLLADGGVSVSGSDSLLGLSTATRSLTVRLMDGNFPKVDQFIPARADNPILVPVDTVIKAVKRAELARDKVGPVHLAFRPGQLTVGATDGDNRLSEPLDLDYDGEGYTVAVNPHFLADALHAAGGPQVEMSLNPDPKRPILVTAVNDETYRHFAMPIRTS